MAEHSKLEVLVDEFINVHRPIIWDHLSWYADSDSFTTAINRAARAELGPNLRMHPHQCNVGYEKLSKIRAPLLEALAGQNGFDNFEVLFERVSLAISGLHRIGDLTVYDTALRLGAYFKASPSQVFLQCDARLGAATFFAKFRAGVSFPRSRSISTDYFLPELEKLSPFEIENFLCVMAQRI